MVLDLVFDDSLSIDQCKDAWRTIGIAPFTRKYLQDKNVQHKLILLLDGSIDLATNPNVAALVAHKKKNSVAIEVLNKNAPGFNGEVFHKYASR